MPLEYFDPEDSTADIVTVLMRDGAAVVRHEIGPEVVDAVRAELRSPFDKVGTCDESDFNGYKTLRVSGVLGVSHTSAELVAHPRVMAIADAILLPKCLNYRIGSLTAIEIHPGETDQFFHTDDGIYPMRIPGVEFQLSAMWALEDFTQENGATRVVIGSHLESAEMRDLQLEKPRKKYAAKITTLNNRTSSQSAEPSDGQCVSQAIMPKGSVLFYLGSTLHGGGANRSNAPRAGLINTYALGWLRQEENQILNVPREAADQHSETIRHLMGYRMHGTLGAFQFPDGTWSED